MRSSPGAAAICCRAAVTFHHSSARCSPTLPAGRGAAMCAAICSSESLHVAAGLLEADSVNRIQIGTAICTLAKSPHHCKNEGMELWPLL